MALGRLTPLQERVLVLLAGLDPPWTLSGGGALVGFHTFHRETRDLDLFWQLTRHLGGAPVDVRRRLEDAGLGVGVIQSGDSFCRLSAHDGGDSIVIDLVADPVPLAEPPGRALVQGVAIQVDTPHQLLVNKLCALLSRSELRDLTDVKALLDKGCQLERGLADCPAQDAGFSPLTFAWALRGLPVAPLARALVMAPAEIEALGRFRDALVDRVLAQTRPDE